MVFFTSDKLFQEGYTDTWVKYFPDCQETHTVLGKSVMLLYSEKALRRAYEHNPEMNIIVVLRNPIERAYSAYWYARRIGWEHIKTFEEAIAIEKKRLKEGWEKWYQCAYIHNSTYYPHLKKVIEIFGKDRINVLLTDELKKDSLKICKEIYSIMAIDHTFSPDVSFVYNRKAMARSETLSRLMNLFIMHGGPVKGVLRKILTDEISTKLRSTLFKLNEKEADIPDLNQSTRARLIEIFRPSNERLESLLGIDLSMWN
jgi:hypothetical protein